MNAGKRTREAAYDRTGYANVADKFVTCVQREGSHSITSDDCDNLLSLLAERDALRDATRVMLAKWDDQDAYLDEAADNLRAALALADGAK